VKVRRRAASAGSHEKITEAAHHIRVTTMIGRTKSKSRRGSWK